MAAHAHISSSFDAELQALKQQVLSMGARVEAAIASATRALVARDAEAARAVIEADREVNKREIRIDEECIRLLALRQPAASDLRFIAATLKIVVDLERIGDLAVNMAERVIALAAEPPHDFGVDLSAMSDIAEAMLRDVLDAFVSGDVAKAERVIVADAEVDRRLGGAFEALRSAMERDGSLVGRGVATLFFAKHLERLADHTTNVAEMVVYLVRGKDVRHADRR
jgi:phosphate transport system protein